MSETQPTDNAIGSPEADGPPYHAVETDGGWQLKPGQDPRPEGEPTEADAEASTEADKPE